MRWNLDQNMAKPSNSDAWSQARWGVVIPLSLATFGYFWSLPFLGFASFMGGTRLWIAIPGFAGVPVVLVLLWRWAIRVTRPSNQQR
jgi:hypothetical protein